MLQPNWPVTRHDRRVKLLAGHALDGHPQKDQADIARRRACRWDTRRTWPEPSRALPSALADGRADATQAAPCGYA